MGDGNVQKEIRASEVCDMNAWKRFKGWIGNGIIATGVFLFLLGFGTLGMLLVLVGIGVKT